MCRPAANVLPCTVMSLVEVAPYGGTLVDPVLHSRELAHGVIMVGDNSARSDLRQMRRILLGTAYIA